MEETFVPLRGIKNDLKGRLVCYKQDWTSGLRAGYRYQYLFNGSLFFAILVHLASGVVFLLMFSLVFRILAPTTYIFFASAIPVISFGEQLERSTGESSSNS